MRKAAIIALVALTALLPTLYGCKTSEENYRRAYEKAVATDDDDMPLDSTIYGANRRQMNSRTVETALGPVTLRTHMVRITEGGGGIRENLKRYNVVAGQFKQLFNAKSMRERLVDSGYPGAFVVETAEPYYYIVAGSYATLDAAAEAMAKIAADGNIAMKAPCPFVLDATARRPSK